MTTARTLIVKSLQTIGALYKGEQPSADEANDALFTLNAMISSWSNRSMLISARVRETFVTSGGVASYSIGIGGTWNTSRPISIVAMYITNGGIDYPVESMSDEEYANISFKQYTLPYPSFYNYTNAVPLGDITFYEVPSGAFPLTIYSEKEITEFTDLDTDNELAPGWDLAIIYNLSILLAPQYGVPVDQATVAIAKSALYAIETAISKSRDLDYPYDLQASQNIFSGYYVRR